MICHVSLAFAFLIGMFPFFPRQDENKWVIWKGRVIDKRGRPVARAKVFVDLAVPVDDTSGSMAFTDDKGVFEIWWRSLPSPQKAVLYVSAGLPEDAVAPIDFPFSDILKKNQVYAGQPVIIRQSNQEVQLGDVQEQVRYGLVSLHLPETVMEDLSLESIACSGLWLRVRNLAGDIVSEEQCISGESISKPTAAIPMALPAGSWKIEVALSSKGKAWRGLDGPLIVRPSVEPQRVELSLPVDERPPERVHAKPNYTRRMAKEKLMRTGIDYDRSTFLQKVEVDNVEVVELFLIAGMDANSRKDDGNTALMLAASKGYEEIVRALLDNGADANAKNSINRDETALLLAAFSPHTAIVKALIDRGADVNATLDAGWTPLMLAAGAGQIDSVRLLISAGAHANAKSQDGMTAMIQAKNHPDIIQLLKQAGAKE